LWGKITQSQVGKEAKGVVEKQEKRNKKGVPRETFCDQKTSQKGGKGRGGERGNARFFSNYVFQKGTENSATKLSYRSLG